MFARWLHRPVGRGPRMMRVLAGAVVVIGAGAVGVLGVELARLRLRLRPRPERGAALIEPGGTLVVCGGRVTEEIRDRFVALAGGPRARIVVIPTAHALADDPGVERVLDAWRERGVASACVLHTRSRAEAADPEFARPLAGATGVWIGGGSQAALTATYAGTEVERQLRALLARGGVVGGSSAGAAAMTRVMIADGRGEAVVGRGLGLLPGVVVDQHFLRRNRVRRLLGVLAGHPDLIGLGIDERTAAVIGVRSRRLRLIGESYVVACVPASGGRPARIEILKRGDETDLESLRDPDVVIPSAIELDDVLGEE
jgi:cyanophycinase